MTRSITLTLSKTWGGLSDCNRTWTQNQHSTIWPNRPNWPNGWVFVYELSGSGFESSCSHLNFWFTACFEQRVPWHSGNYRVRIHSETRTWHDKNIHSWSGLIIPALLLIISWRTSLSLKTSTLIWYLYDRDLRHKWVTELIKTTLHFKIIIMINETFCL